MKRSLGALIIAWLGGYWIVQIFLPWRVDIGGKKPNPLAFIWYFLGPLTLIVGLAIAAIVCGILWSIFEWTFESKAEIHKRKALALEREIAALDAERDNPEPPPPSRVYR